MNGNVQRLAVANGPNIFQMLLVCLLDSWQTALTRNLSSHIDLHTHAGSAFDSRVTLTFDLLISRSLCMTRSCRGWHTTAPTRTRTPTSSPTSSRGSSRVVELAMGITSGSRACRTCRRGSSRGCRCRCRRRRIPAIEYMRTKFGVDSSSCFFLLHRGRTHIQTYSHG